MTRDRTPTLGWEQASDAIRHDRTDDGERALEELIQAMGPHAEKQLRDARERVRHDEFVCSSCHMILHRSRLGNRRRMRCRECATA